MANYNTIIVPESALTVSADVAERLEALLHLQAPESGTVDDLPTKFLVAFGEELRKLGLPFLQFDVAYTCSRLIPGSHGGTRFRIMADGEVVWRTETWPDDTWSVYHDVELGQWLIVDGSRVVATGIESEADARRLLGMR